MGFFREIIFSGRIPLKQVFDMKKFLATVTFLSIPAMLLARPWGNGLWRECSFWGGSFMWFFGIAFLIVVCGLFFFFMKGRGMEVLRAENPLDIAKRRYAAGELSKEEFDLLRQDLR